VQGGQRRADDGVGERGEPRGSLRSRGGEPGAQHLHEQDVHDLVQDGRGSRPGLADLLGQELERGVQRDAGPGGRDVEQVREQRQQRQRDGRVLAVGRAQDPRLRLPAAHVQFLPGGQGTLRGVPVEGDRRRVGTAGQHVSGAGGQQDHVAWQ
jgi:hypothetical protein